MDIDNQTPSNNDGSVRLLDTLHQKLVIDQDGLTREPFNDRAKVVEMIESLANRTFGALIKDQAANKRYARTLNLSNKNRNEGNRKKRFHRELINIPLPVQAMTWNDLEVEDIEIQMLDRVHQIHDSYLWYRTRVELSTFVDHATKVLADEDKMRFEEENPSEPSRARSRRQALKKRRDIKVNPVTTEPTSSTMTPTLPEPVQHHLSVPEGSDVRGGEHQPHLGIQSSTPVNLGFIHQIDTQQAMDNVETLSQEAPITTVVHTPEAPVESPAHVITNGIAQSNTVPKKRGRPKKNVEGSGISAKVKRKYTRQKAPKDIASPKKKMGRPRKAPITNDDDDDEIEFLGFYPSHLSSEMT